MAGQLSQECEPYILPLFDDHSEALMGKNVSWLCRALGSHDLELYWRLPQELYGGGNIQEGTCQQRACVKENTLTVRYLHPSDTGKYTCVAKNKFGQDQRKVTLTVKVNSAYCQPRNIQFTSNRSLFGRKETTTATQNCRKKVHFSRTLHSLYLTTASHKNERKRRRGRAKVQWYKHIR